MGPVTITETLAFLQAPAWDDVDSPTFGAFLHWPPDAFAVTAYLLRESGAYVQVVNRYSHPKTETCELRARRLRELADVWRDRYLTGGEHERRCPDEVVKWWRTFVQIILRDRGRKKETPVQAILEKPALWQPLVEICTAADEACAGFGLFNFRKSDSNERARRGFLFSLLGLTRLLELLKDRKAATLCEVIDSSRVAVLPKMHTAQMGITVRSISHHLTLGSRSDIRAGWATNLMPPREHQRGRHTQSRNLLVIPWPLEAAAAQFGPVKCNAGALGHLPGHHDFFAYTPTPNPPIVAFVKRVLDAALRQVGPIHGIVFPEMALSPRQFDAVFKAVFNHVDFLVAGVYEPPTTRRFGKNYARICMKVSLLADEGNDGRRKGRRDSAGQFYVDVTQDKHHRWFLDREQIKNYGLGGRLDPSRKWWECIELSRRSITFFALDPLFAFTVLICEDLARPEPVGDLIRAVGPNLVIALLQDGPQLAARWPARYATSLVDDPGCSVLTVTSLGMAQLSRPMDSKTKEPMAPSRAVALWRDQQTGTREISLPEGADALVLTLMEERQQEWTLDGRGDRYATGAVVLGGVHAVKTALKPTKRATRRPGR